MGIPFVQKAGLGSYLVSRMLARSGRFPLVLMLEPLFRCNLKCPGCGKIAQSEEVMRARMSVAECVAAVQECGAPIVSIPGGEPMLHPDIGGIVAEIVALRRFVYLCSNGLLVPDKLDLFTPSPYLTFTIHVDGLAERHDRMVDRPGTFDKAVAAIRLLVSRGFRVNTNTTLFAGDDPGEVARLFDLLTGLGVEGLTLSPGFSYESAAGAGFLQREESREFFRRLFALSPGRGWRFSHSSLYLRFLAGEEQYRCTPWGNPTRNVLGWQRPCYLLGDGYAPSFAELMAGTDWEAYGTDRDERCRDCMVHCGFEPTAVLDSVRHPLKALRAARFAPTA